MQRRSCRRRGGAAVEQACDIEIAQSELANALNSVEIQQMVGWLATQYQRLAAKAERDGQYAAACGCLNSLRVMLRSRNWIGNLKRTSEAVSRTMGTAGSNCHHYHGADHA